MIDERADLVEFAPEIGLLDGKCIHDAPPFLRAVLVVLQDVIIIQERLALKHQSGWLLLFQHAIEPLVFKINAGAFVHDVAQKFWKGIRCD